MKKYLDPKADLTFKKVFGEHKDLVISFMNALLPFENPRKRSRMWNTSILSSSL